MRIYQITRKDEQPKIIHAEEIIHVKRGVLFLINGELVAKIDSDYLVLDVTDNYFAIDIINAFKRDLDDAKRKFREIEVNDITPSTLDDAKKILRQIQSQYMFLDAKIDETILKLK